MSKQKIILLIFIFILLVAVGFFFFFIQKEKNKIENIDNDFLDKEKVEFKTNEEIILELESYRKPTSEIEIPYNTPTDDTIKTDEEIKEEINSFKPKKEDSLNLTNEQILQLLENPNLAN